MTKSAVRVSQYQQVRVLSNARDAISPRGEEEGKRQRRKARQSASPSGGTDLCHSSLLPSHGTLVSISLVLEEVPSLPLQELSVLVSRPAKSGCPSRGTVIRTGLRYPFEPRVTLR